MCMTTYSLKYKDKHVLYEGIRSSWDAIYFKLFHQELPDQKQKIGDYEVWWTFSQTQGYGKEPTIEANIHDLRLGRSFKVQIYCRTKRRKNSLGDREIYRIYELSHYDFKRQLNSRWETFNLAIDDHKKVLKKNWDIFKRATAKAALKEALKNSNISKEEYKKQLAEKRKEAKRKKSVGESVERTKRILLLAPLLAQLRDEIDVVLKQYNEGRGDVGYHLNKADKLKDFIRHIKSFQT